jgi:thioredoxin-like negative regulator of GroEL
VCQTLKPKVRAMLQERFPNIAYHYIDCEESKEVAAQNSIFAVPTIVVYFDGRETIRKSRFVGVAELADEMERPYDLMFSS